MKKNRVVQRFFVVFLCYSLKIFQVRSLKSISSSDEEFYPTFNSDILSGIVD